jgi:hypothetical protein
MTMTLALPLDIVNRIERRWSARAARTESFQTQADRLKNSTQAVAEGVQPPDEPAPQPRDEQPKPN